MREIKFRAWGDFGKKMHYQTKEEDLWSFLRNAYGMELMQYTGLKDKNGKEIYEGDFVKDEIRYEVMFGEYEVDEYTHTGFFLFHSANNEGMLSKDDCNFLTVIGNIYENAELLK